MNIYEHPVYGQQPDLYRHVEAYCLMEYASQDGCECEWLWNSRDGVTPYSIRSRLGTELRHVNWNADRRIVAFRPQPGSRIFVDMTPEIAREYAERIIGKHWDQNTAAIQKQYASREEAIEQIAQGMLTSGAPAIKVVTADGT